MTSVLNFGDPRLHPTYWARVNPHGGIPTYAPHLGECWVWTGATTAQGYGCYNRLTQGVHPNTAHRAMMTAIHGKISREVHTDHLCRVRTCVNPTHLELVSARVNTLRGYGAAAKKARRTHCDKGHPLSGDNLQIKEGKYGPYRQCRTCYVSYYMEKYEPHGTPHYAKTECPKGHPYDSDNTYWRKNKSTGNMDRGCRKCRSEAARKSHERRRARESAARGAA